MSLDARVYCDCVERGRLRTPYPFPDRLYVGEYGGPAFRSDGLDEATESDCSHAHYQWIENDPCEHSGCVLLHHWIGNIGGVAGLRASMHALSPQPKTEYPIIRCKIIYNAIHDGYLTLDLVQHLQDELQRLRQADLSILPSDDAGSLMRFMEQMEELVQAALSVRKPICF